jgi:hypothetical protein
LKYLCSFFNSGGGSDEETLGYFVEKEMSEEEIG